jgi:hypothetical protein
MAQKNEKIKTEKESDLAEKFNHLRYLVTLVETYKTGIYSRAQMILAITGAQIALTVTIVGIVIQKVKFGELNLWFGTPFFILLASTLSLLIITGAVIIKTILPHKNLSLVGKIIKKKTKLESEFTWLMSAYNHVTGKTAEEFKGIINNSSVQQMFDDMLIYYYNLCHIVSRRYYILRKGAVLQIYNFILMIVFIAFSFILISIQNQ